MIQKGIFAVYKPKGVSSYALINQIKKQTGQEKVGHAGTLDPLASGVLVVAVGREFTRNLKKIVEAEKEYLAEIKLGAVSQTDDAEGPIVQSAFTNQPTLIEIKTTLKKFSGQIWQTKPRYSAIKLGGKRAYDLARQGKKFNLGQRQVEIKSLELLSYQWPDLKIKITTGPGFYVRALARDLGEELKTGGYLYGLERIRVGQFGQDQALVLPKSSN